MFSTQEKCNGQRFYGMMEKKKKKKKKKKATGTATHSISL